MKSRDADKRFEWFLSGAEATRRLDTPAKGVAAMLSFYRDVRAQDVDIDKDGDMLLFQWGMHDWGEGPQFEVDITRQLVVPDAQDDEIWQLHVTYRFSPSEDLRLLGSGHRWCQGPWLVQEFSETVSSHAAYKAVAGREDGTLHIEHECVG